MVKFMGKKGLAVIYDPHNLYQFVWYYCNKRKNKKWDALCLPNGYRGEYMHPYCEAAGIFKNIYRNDTDYSTLSAAKKIKLITGMFLYFIMGRRTAYCKKLINQYVNVDEYDELVVIADVGIVSGACVALGVEKEVVILEDGIGDYGKRPKYMPREKLLSAYSWQGFLLSVMGYCSPGWFHLKTDRFCIKYSSQPEKMQYRNYAQIRQLYDDKGTDLQLFNRILYRLYPALSNYDFKNTDVVLLTRRIDDFVPDYEKYKQRLENYISENYSSVLVKKHPREDGAYHFSGNVAVTEIDNSVPAEVLLPYLKEKDIVIITTSAVMLYLKSFNLKCKIILFEGLYEESLKSNSQFRPLSLEEAKKYCETYADGCYEIIQL